MNCEASISFDDLYRAHLRCRKGHRHKQEIIDVELRLSEVLWDLEKELKYFNKFKFEYYHFTIHEPKRREIYACSYRQRLVLYVICKKYLTPDLEDFLVDENMACRKGKGNHRALKLLTAHCDTMYRKNNSSDFYVLKCDIRSYFESIDHKVLREILLSLKLENKFLDLCYRVIDSYGDGGKGLPLGNQTSQSFALVYLDALDKYILSQGYLYCRYMDDFFIFSSVKKSLSLLLKKIDKFVGVLALTLNPKTQVFKVSQGFNALGFRYKVLENGKIVRRLRSDSKRHVVKNLKRLQKMYSIGVCDADDLSLSLVSIRAHMNHGHTML